MNVIVMSNGSNKLTIAGRTVLRMATNKMQNATNTRKRAPTSAVKNGYERRQSNDSKGYENNRK